MSKKLLVVGAMMFITIGAFAQTIVSTTPENKKAILEEYTGINCVFCPQGHAIAQAIKDANPDDVFLINIHVGGFATPSGNQPDFRTPFGSAIASQAGVTGYPQGSMNRHVFSGSSTAMGRGQWTSAANSIMSESAYLNMGVEAEIDVAASELTVHVEAFYTGDSPQATNKLNVALLQNNTLGPQTGGNMGNNYVHQHRLVHLVTGQWGDDVSPTTQGTLIDETYTYTIPADYNGVPVVLTDLEVVVFMTETTQEIISGNGAYPSYVNLPFDNDASIESDFELADQCGVDFAPTVTIQNNGNNPLTSLSIDYSINGGATETYNWTGNLGPFESEDIVLDPIPYTVQANNTVSFTIPSDDDNSNNTATNTFSEISEENTSTLELYMALDENGDEVTWSIINSNGDLVTSGGPYSTDEVVDITFNIPEIDCYQFILNDSGNDGEYFVRLRDSEGDVILNNPSSSNFGSAIQGTFKLNGILSISENTANLISIYPNPASNVIHVRNAENASIEVFDILGKKLMQVDAISQEEQLDVARLQTGTYLMKITSGSRVTTKRFVITR
ncbi:MAG: Omp28-related outer membrane protein [Marinirhabdus sp.]|nr:Omp28-related outer membrane protein [Marinirhabdus sp.]